MRNICRFKAQSIMEYTIILSIVVAALIAMQVYMKRGVQSAIKAAADQLGTQTEGEVIDLGKGGYLLGANSVTNMKSTQERIFRDILVSQFPEETDARTIINSTTNTYSKEAYNLGEYEY